MKVKSKKLKALENKINQKNFWQKNDPKKAQKMSQEYADLKETIQFWSNLNNELEELQELAKISKDDEKIQQEIIQNFQSLKTKFKKKEIELFFKGKYDPENALLFVYSGAGGTEAMDWTRMLAEMYEQYFNNKGFKYEIIDRMKGEEAGFKRIGYEIKGKNAFGWLKSEKGVHRLIRLSPFNADKLRHTSFALVEVLPNIQKENIEKEIDTKNLKIDFYRSGGPGGQHANKTASAVRISHIPTGLVVTSQNQRSQHQNRDKAMQVLYSRLINLKEKQQAEDLKQLKGENKEIAWGSQARTYVLHPYKQVRDHRTKLKSDKVDDILKQGKLNPFIYEYLKGNF